MSYIIRNCPCFNEGHPMLDYYGECLSLTDDAQGRKDCTNCIMKQIVEKCMEDWEDTTTDKFQRELLDLLNIREVDD